MPDWLLAVLAALGVLGLLCAPIVLSQHGSRPPVANPVAGVGHTLDDYDELRGLTLGRSDPGEIDRHDKTMLVPDSALRRALHVDP